jgi:hypothetical protein
MEYNSFVSAEPSENSNMHIFPHIWLLYALNYIYVSYTGEAVYVDDIPVPKGCLYGAFIYSTRPHAHVKGINFKSSLASQKVITVITAKDIPRGGQNIGSSFPMLGEEVLFADQVVEFAGQNIGIVVRLLKLTFIRLNEPVINQCIPRILKILSSLPRHVGFRSHRFLKHKGMLIWLQSKLLLSIAQKICSHQF